MVKNNLIKKISGVFCAVTLGSLIGANIGYSKEINPEGYKLPDLSRAIPIGEPYRYDDLTDKIEGPETRVDGYQTGDSNINRLSKENPMTTISKLSINGKVFFYGVKNWVTGEYYALVDSDGDGKFETKYDSGDLTVDKDGNFPAKKDLPPEWVLE